MSENEKTPIEKLLDGEDLYQAFTSTILRFKWIEENYIAKAEEMIDIPEDIVEFFKSKNCMRYTDLTEEDQIFFRVRFC